jgi:signal transduction histidine kinase
MGSGASSLRAFVAPRMLLGVWLPIAVIGLLHYTTHSEQTWVHNVLRRVYYLPIVAAAFQLGLRGGLSAAIVVSITYLPHAFLHLGHLAHTDPADAVDKALEMTLYNLVGALAGALADALRRRQRALEAALDEQRRLQKTLVRAGRLGALGEVVAGIAHELRNPIHSLKGTAEVVDPLIPEAAEERRMWELHVSELDRLARVADRFLSFSNPRDPEIVPIDLRDVARRVEELAGTDARKRGITLEAAPGSARVSARGDRDQLAQVALNIVLNAMRAIGDEGGRIRITTEAHKDGAAMTIENDGPPIPEEEIEHLFDPFHTGHADGTGLGLSISERIMEQHGGHLEVANAGLGVAFTMRLPG